MIAKEMKIIAIPLNIETIRNEVLFFLLTAKKWPNNSSDTGYDTYNDAYSLQLIYHNSQVGTKHIIKCFEA